MIELGMIMHIAKLEEISVAASREFTLETNLIKMQEEWMDITLEFVPFR